jgi:hypothetical protein
MRQTILREPELTVRVVPIAEGFADPLAAAKAAFDPIGCTTSTAAPIRSPVELASRVVAPTRNNDEGRRARSDPAGGSDSLDASAPS